MPSPALRILERVSRGTHDALFGEWGTLRGGGTEVEVKARINRSIKQSSVRLPVDMIPDQASVIWYSKTLSRPMQDYVFVDESGNEHIHTHDATDLGHAWEVLCRVAV